MHIINFKKTIKISLALSILSSSIGISYAAEMPIVNKGIEVDVKVDVPPKYGRSRSEF